MAINPQRVWNSKHGPTQQLDTPLHVLTELSTWSNTFKHAMKHYLNQESEDHALPVVPHPEIYMRFPRLEPTSMEYEDSRPVILGGDYLDRIGRRQVYARVDYEDVEPDTTDYQLVESAMYSLSYYMKEQLTTWYNQNVIPIRQGCTVAELLDEKERITERLFGSRNNETDSMFPPDTKWVKGPSGIAQPDRIIIGLNIKPQPKE